MSFDRDLWSGAYARARFPRFHCSHCKTGRLHFDKDTIVVSEPQYSKGAREHPDWEPDWNIERFSAKLVCDDTACGEVVVVSGDTIAAEYFDEDFNVWGYMELLRPQFFFPAPPVIGIPNEVPSKITDEIGKASQLFWVDLNSCANRLRVSVELLLTDFKIPEMGLDKNGKPKPLDLNARIALFEKVDPEHAQTLTALRVIGNLGSHGSDVAREPLIDAFEIYEDALTELYGQRKARIAKLRKKLIDTRGRY